MPRPADNLPRRPLLTASAPVLDRGAGVRQVGLDPRTAVVVSGPGSGRLLGLLDGQRTLSQLTAAARQAGMAAADVYAVLLALQQAGLLQAAVELSPYRPACVRGGAVRLVGLGPLGQQVASLLVASGLHVYAAPSTPTKRTAARAALSDLSRGASARGGRLTLVNHWTKPEDADTQLTVVAPDTVEPDRAMTESLLRDDQPHLVVRSAGSSVVVGPLVLPGRTACLRCTDLTRRDADPGWPTLLPQLTSLRLPHEPVLLAWAAGVAASQVLGCLDRQEPEVAGATLELDTLDHRSRWRPWPVHQRCGCAWAATTEWAP